MTLHIVLVVIFIHNFTSMSEKQAFYTSLSPGTRQGAKHSQTSNVFIPMLNEVNQFVLLNAVQQLMIHSKLNKIMVGA